MCWDASLKIGETQEPDTILPHHFNCFLLQVMWGPEQKDPGPDFRNVLHPPDKTRHPIGSQGKPRPLLTEASTSGVRVQRCSEIPCFPFSPLGAFHDNQILWKGVWHLPDTHVCLKIYIFNFLAHFLTAYIKEHCKCLEKSKFFLDTCSSTKLVDPLIHAKKRLTK